MLIHISSLLLLDLLVFIILCSLTQPSCLVILCFTPSFILYLSFTINGVFYPAPKIAFLYQEFDDILFVFSALEARYLSVPVVSKVSTIICCLSFWGLLLQIPIFLQQPSSFFNIRNILFITLYQDNLFIYLFFKIFYKTNDQVENLCIYRYIQISCFGKYLQLILLVCYQNDLIKVFTVKDELVLLQI